MFVCVAGKNDISVEILEYLVERQEDRYEIGVVCNKNETGKDSWQKSAEIKPWQNLYAI